MTFYNQHSTALVGSGSENNQGGYKIERSLRFRSSASAYLSRTPASASNRKTWTWSGWVKRSKLTANQVLFAAGNGTYDSRTEIILDAQDNLYLISDHRAAAGTYYGFDTVAVFRDPSAWYHIVVVWDTTQATNTNRLKMYVNNVAYTLTVQNIWMPQNHDGYINSTSNHYISKTNHNSAPNQYLDGYLTEVNFIDGQALDPSYFGETDTDTGVWKAKEYTGTYGTNGFYLNFSDNTSTTTLGYDQSSNSNNWTANNISLTAGSTYDSMTDVPTLTSPTAANYCTLNPLRENGSVITEGNLKAAVDSSGSFVATSTFSVTSGKWYWECTPTASNNMMIGISDSSVALTSIGLNSGNSWYYYANNGYKYYTSGVAYGASFGVGDVIGVALDMDVGSITFYKNNSSQGVAFNTNISGKSISPSIGTGGGTGNVTAINFGQRPFAYTPPTGFKALNTYNLPDSTVKDGGDYFGVGLWTGDGVNGRDIPNLYNFTPDAVWIKNRSAAIDHNFADVLRTWKELYPNLNTAEGSQQMNAPVNNGLSGLPNANGYNNNTNAYVSWVWKANGSGVSNTDGSITSTVSANTTSGFSIISYAGASANSTIGHGLGVAPSMFIVKRRDNYGAATYDWYTYHASLGNTNFMRINTSGASTTYNLWQNTTPSSSVIYLANDVGVNGSGANFICYAFAPIEGFSAFGSYAGNSSSDGPFIYCGFRPRWIMIRSTSSAREWNCWDTARGPYNLNNGGQLNLGDAHAEYTGSLYDAVLDVLSNGFKLRSGASPNYNQGETYIYAVFAENPFKNSLAR